MYPFDVRQANGVLCVGDPHVSSRKPGTRNDADFISTVMGKLAQVAEIANRANLVTCFLGDLFNRAQEPDVRLMVELLQVLKLFKQRPWTIVGNHDLAETSLTMNTSLALLRETGLLQVADTPGVFLLVQKPDGTQFCIGGSPYGYPIPTDVAEHLDKAGLPGTPCAWLTHADLAFEGAYPGAHEMHPVQGCSLVVNGHMHLTKEPQVHGETTWFNPGNITRQSKDTANHVPSAWEFGGAVFKPVQHRLVYDPEVFASAIPAAMDAAPTLELSASAFVQTLRDFEAGETARTEDGSELAKDIALVLESTRASAAVAQTLAELHALAVNAEA